MIIKCQYTGIEFEAASKRQKNHPLVSELLNEAANDKRHPGGYNAAKKALEQGRELGFTTIEQFINHAKAAMAGKAQSIQKAEQASIQAEREAKQRQQNAKEARAKQNAFLRKHGYKWWKEYSDYDEYEEGEPSEWVLHSPDGRAVSVAQALDEIERGADVVLAEIEAERKAEEEKRIRREQIKAATETISRYIIEYGERPHLGSFPKGEKLFDTFNIYGTGHMFIIEPEGAIWYLINNGMDGDDWRLNNLPGCIGYRLNVSEDEAEQNEYGNGNAAIAEALRQLATGQPLADHQLTPFKVR